MLARYIIFGASVLAAALAIGPLVRTRRNAARWTFSLGFILLGTDSLCTAYIFSSATLEGAQTWIQIKHLCISLLPIAWLSFSLTYARGNASYFLRKWKVMLASAGLIPACLALAYNGHLSRHPQYGNLGRSAVFPYTIAGVALHLCLLVAAIIVLMNLERTFRAAVGTLRWRIKYLLIGVGVIFVTRVYTTSQVLLFQTLDFQIQFIDSAALLLGGALIIRSFFRAGYFDTDVYPSEYVIQNSLTVVLAGVYLFAVGICAKLVGTLGGLDAFAFEAFLVMAAVVVLVVLLQSDRARLFVRDATVRHFQRPLYDYRSIWRKFIEATSVETNEDHLCRTAARLVVEASEALSVSILLYDPGERTLRLAASTSTAASVQPVEMNDHQCRDLVQSIENNPASFDLELRQEEWAETLRKQNPAQFPHGGHRLCLPLQARNALLGLLIVGDRVNGVPFSQQDSELLTCLRDHIAASLLNIQLARRISETKELQAFQAMAAFFVHDLKNAASTLNLTVQNLPNHFKDPAFRDDALRAVSKSALHLNNLVGRLSTLRQELQVRPKLCDPATIVHEVISEIEKTRSVDIIRSFSPVPELNIDKDQMTKVVTNLILNAIEANTTKQSIEVSLSTSEDWAAIKVRDEGRGMTREFVERSLFRPFQSTKKNGMGIGVFQSKIIVEAHGGRLSVESVPQKGTVFTIHLPAVPVRTPV